MENEKTELVVRIGYWGTDSRERVESAMARLREDRGLTEEDKPWLVHYYPADGPVGLLEFLLDPSEEQIAAMEPTENVPAEPPLATETEDTPQLPEENQKKLEHGA